MPTKTTSPKGGKRGCLIAEKYEMSAREKVVQILKKYI